MKNKHRNHRGRRQRVDQQRPPAEETKAWKMALEIYDGLLDILASQGLLPQERIPPAPVLASFHDHSVHVGPIGPQGSYKPDPVLEELQQSIHRYEKLLNEKEKKIENLEQELEFLGPAFARQTVPA